MARFMLGMSMAGDLPGSGGFQSHKKGSENDPLFTSQRHNDVSVSDDIVYHAEGEDDRMPISLRGFEYRVVIGRLSSDPDTTLYKLAKKWALLKARDGSKVGVFHIDRNPAIFHCVLDYYSTGQLHLPDGVCGYQLRRDIAFWGLKPHVIAPCCLWKIRQGWDTRYKTSDILSDYKRMKSRKHNTNGWRDKAWNLYIQPFSTPLAITRYAVSLVMSVVFQLCLVLQAMGTFREPLLATPAAPAVPYMVTASVPPPEMSNSSGDEGRPAHAQTDLYLWFRASEAVVLAFLTLHQIFWFMVCPAKKEFYFSAMPILSSLALFIQWIPVGALLVYESYPDWVEHLSIIKIARIVLVWKLLSPYRSMRVIGRALVDSHTELGLLLILVLICSTLLGYLVFYFELSQEDTHFRTFPDGIWWGVVTLTTVGYGDMYPQGWMGRIVGMACAIISILVVAVPVPVIAENFTKTYRLTQVAEFYQRLKWDEGDVPKVDDCGDEAAIEGKPPSSPPEEGAPEDTEAQTPDSAVHIVETATMINGHGPGVHL